MYGFASLMPEGLIAGSATKYALEHGLLHEANDSWTAFDADPTDHPFTVFASSTDAWRDVYVLQAGGGLATVSFDRACEVKVTAHGASPTAAATILEKIRAAIPAAENPDEGKIPVTFWTYTVHGPDSVSRSLDAPVWSEITGNYSAPTLEQLGKLFDPQFRPGHGGQFVLWHGEPGTGKTTALRALAREWREWCSFHYIADPDNFFGAHADYMLDVLIRQDGRAAIPGSDDTASDRWRVLILEDTGELLQPDAREKLGQALPRFLNCVDGMIGQGLRVLVLVTTNEPLGKLHPAVTRPGRSALTVDFEPLSAHEAAEWLSSRGLPPEAGQRRILADLYARLDGFEGRQVEQSPVGFQQ